MENLQPSHCSVWECCKREWKSSNRIFT